MPAPPAVKCHSCQSNDAHVHVIDVNGPGTAATGYQCDERDFCDECAARMDLPSVPTKQLSEIWKLLESAKRRHDDAGVACPHCGMTLAEFRSKGRLGCPHDYEVFREHLDPLLERIHNACAHVGRVPGGEIERPAESAGTAPAGLGAPTTIEAAALPFEPSAAPAEAADSTEERERERLARRLKEAVAKEDYEHAAQLRDELRSLAGDGPSTEDGEAASSGDPDAGA